MEHARKMVLVPEAMVKNIQPMKNSQIQQESATESTKSVQTPGNVSSRLDKDMYDILHADVKDKRQKWKLFSQALQRFLFSNDDKHESSNGQTECAESTDEDALDSGGDVVTLVNYSDENIINSVPNTYRWKCEQLLRCLHGCGQEHISWDDSGTVRINGTAIPDSNIVDLVNLAVRWRKSYSAVGEQEFANFLQKSTIPREFIGNTSLLNDGSDTPLTNLKRKYGRISRHFSDSAVTPSNLAEPPQSGDEKEADNVEDCSEVFNETADSTLGYSTPGTKKKKPSWATLTLNK
ncbi:hypothetical protein QAD02_012903 [Eretmocerus hayati]|uniref:Uncharacterized protein n=1 Tax=Eretmocerus hayati TaxID=131215 RepID=A0ACC2P224_9HYME|nr:hypothetical protein QAD02_012903 [Eretmocerus hayati]